MSKEKVTKVVQKNLAVALKKAGIDVNKLTPKQLPALAKVLKDQGAIIEQAIAFLEDMTSKGSKKPVAKKKVAKSKAVNKKVAKKAVKKKK